MKYSLRHRLQQPEPVLAAFVNVPTPALVEIAAYTGFDAVVLDAEHGALTQGDIEALIRAAESSGIASIVRVPTVSREFVLRALDSGASGILAPQVNDAGTASQVVAEALFPPVGRRGAGFYARAFRYTLDRGSVAIADANANVTVGVQLETRRAVEQAGPILTTPGIGLGFVGPTDLAVDHGSVDTEHPWVQQAIADIANVGRECGVPMGIYAPTPSAARRYIDLGYRFIATGATPLLVQAATDYVRGVRA